MLTNNIKQFKLILYLLTAIAVIIQLLLSKSTVDFFSVALLLAANLILISYCYNEKYFFDYPISLNIIFISCIFSYAGAFYYNTLELRHINSKLLSAIEVISTLSYYWLTIIVSHIIYRKLDFCRNLKKKLTNFYFNLNLMSVVDYKFLIFLTVVGYSAYIYSYNQSIVSEKEGFSILIDITRQMGVFILTPIIIFFAKDLYNVDKDFPRIKTLLICIIIILLISLTRFHRGAFFYMIFIFVVIFIFNFQLEYRRMNIFTFKFFFSALILIFGFQFLELVSLNYLKQRGSTHNVEVKNISLFFKNFNIKEIRKYKRESSLYADRELADFVYENTIFNRVNKIYIHDQLHYIYTTMSKADIEEIRTLETNKIISVLPQPVINLFFKDFDKQKYIAHATAGLMKQFHSPHFVLARQEGSTAVGFKLYFGNLFPIPLFILALIVFTISDSLYDKNKNLISPIFILCCAGFGGGILTIFASAGVDKMLFLFFRKFPTVMLMYFLLLYIFNAFQKKS